MHDIDLINTGRNNIIHNDMSIDFHINKFVFFAMEIDTTKSIFKRTKRCFYIPTLVIQLFHTLNGELIAVKISNKDFPTILSQISPVICIKQGFKQKTPPTPLL